MMQALAHPAITRYRDRVMACWLGKAVGGTLGMPLEGQEGPHSLTFYNPIPEKMMPNDDLDLQVVWACTLDKMAEVSVDRHVLAQAWLDHVTFPWCEYGVALRNLRSGLHAPLSGSFDNWYTDSMGAPIRSEIWACLAPGDPKLAAGYAFEDACVDHGREGIWAEMFLAALESAAFVEHDRDVLLDQALAFLPEATLTHRAVSDTRSWWRRGNDWLKVREKILERYDSEDFTDAPMNMAFTILGWLAGDGDFSKSICIAVNCGKDTDCTGATLGAILGILDPACISERWLAPIGRSLVLNKGIVGLAPPETLDGLTNLMVTLRKRLHGREPHPRDFKETTKQFRIHADIAFVHNMPYDEVAPALVYSHPLTLPGSVGTYPVVDFRDDVMLLRFKFTLRSEQAVRVMFDTREENCVWLDGLFVFSQNAGRMMPSFHMLADDRRYDGTLDAGEHELIAAVRKPTTRQYAEWVIGIGDLTTLQWIPNVFAHSA